MPTTTPPTDPQAALTAALVAAQAAMPTIPKTRTASIRSDKGSYTYKYADLADTVAALGPVLAEHGLVFVSTPEVQDGRPVLVGHLLHVGGGSLTGTLPLLGGSTPQAMGSAITYARRYLLSAMTGAVTDEDDDGGTAQRDAVEAPARARRAKIAADTADQIVRVVTTTPIGPERTERLTLLWGTARQAGALDERTALPGWADGTTLRALFSQAAEHTTTDEDQA